MSFVRVLIALLVLVAIDSLMLVDARNIRERLKNRPHPQAAQSLGSQCPIRNPGSVRNITFTNPKASGERFTRPSS